MLQNDRNHQVEYILVVVLMHFVQNNNHSRVIVTLVPYFGEIKLYLQDTVLDDILRPHQYCRFSIPTVIVTCFVFRSVQDVNS